MSKYRFQKKSTDFATGRMQEEIEDNFTSKAELAAEIAKVENLPRNYAEMYIDDTAPSAIAVTAGTPIKSTGWTKTMQVQGFTVENSRFTYTVDRQADFQINSSVSFTASAINAIIEMWIYKNGTEIMWSELHCKVGTPGDVGNAGQTLLIKLNKGDYLELYIDTDKNATVTIDNGNINIMSVN